MPTNHVFAGFPSAHLVADVQGNPPAGAKGEKLKELLWGDYITVEGEQGAWYKARCRGVKGWIRKADTQTERLLEIVFVDIGQGDGALVVTPDDRKYVIDAGEGDNMHRFLRWRFGKFKSPVTFDAAVISHSDLDHYGGFDDLFKEPNLSFQTVYHNGLVERAAANPSEVLGPRVRAGNLRYIQDLVPTLADLQARLADPAFSKGKKYPTMLKTALKAGKFGDFRMLSVPDGHLPGHGPGDSLPIEILGPFPESIGGKPSLRWLGDVGKTKNGHSVVFRLNHGNIRVFLGGDLNTESSRLLLELHTGVDSTDAEGQVAAAASKFTCDIAKACHHGSEDTHIPFLRAVKPIATVVSSGDDEPHAHPRAGALGAFGKFGRGERPLIFSTELARSHRDTIKQPNRLRARMKELNKTIADAATPATERERAEKEFNKLVDSLERSVAVYGAINLRSDGKRVVMAYKLEQSKPERGWDKYVLEPDGPGGELVYRSKYDE